MNIIPSNTDWITGRTFVLTGGFDEETLDWYDALITSVGGIKSRQLKHDADYLIWEEYGFGETIKLKQAREYNGQGCNITIYTTEEFLRIVQGEEVTPATKQISHKITHIAKYIAATDMLQAEQYLETHVFTMPGTQAMLYELFLKYNMVTLKSQEKWCEKILESEGITLKLLQLAASYFIRTGDYDKAEILCGRIAEEYPSAPETEEKLWRDLEHYRSNPYWPQKKILREDLASIYDRKGIPHPAISSTGACSKPSVTRVKCVTPEREEELRNMIDNVDYSTDSDNKYSWFIDSSAFNISGIGQKRMNLLIDGGWIHTFGDVFRLKDHKEEIVEAGLFTPSGMKQALDSIEKARTVTDVKFLNALHIPNIGEDSARAILEQHPIEELFQIGEYHEDLYRLCDVKNIGIGTSAAVLLWFENDSNQEMLQDLLTEVTIVNEEKGGAEGTCAGKTFVVTGKVFVFRNREELKKYVIFQGGVFSETLNAETDYLINNDIESQSAKNKKAKKLGIPIISEEMFIEQFGEK